MLNKKKIYIILFASLVLLISAAVLWSYVVTKDFRDPSQKEKSVNQVATVKNIVVTETKEGKIYWELYAEKGSYRSSDGGAELINTLGNFYNSDNEVVMSFSSDTGTYSAETKEISLKGNAHVVAYDGSSISADKLTFKGKEEGITAEGHVVIQRNQDFITHSKNARFNTELTFFEISGETQTDIYTKDGAKVQNLIKK